MNIQLLTPQFIRNNTNTQRNNLNSNNASYPNLKPLGKDTVSFSGQLVSRSESIIGNAIERAYVNGEKHFINLAKQFHGALKRAAQKCSADGFSYDEIYNSKHPIKSKESFVDKYSRQGYVQDTIRGTIYWADQQNIPSLKKFLDAMEAEGFKVSALKKYNPKTGKFKRVPDMEIRQNGITKEDLKPLGEFLQKAEISKPRSSTYSDFQLRFTRNNVDMELIFLYGPHYSHAKELESKYVYNIVRELGKLHIDTKANYSDKSAGKRIVNYLDVIKTRLVEDISKPLFTNAANTDLKIRDLKKMPISISKLHASSLDNSITDMIKKLPKYYSELKKQIKTDEYVINHIKNSPYYAERSVKTITQGEIKVVRDELLSQLPIQQAEDIGTLATAHTMLKETLKKYCEK